MKERAAWENWFTLFLGAWLFATPWVFATSANWLSINWNFWAVGAIIAVLSIIALWTLKLWEEAFNLILGGWMFASPWLFGYSDVPALFWNSLIAGSLVFLSAAMAASEAGRAQTTFAH